MSLTANTTRPAPAIRPTTRHNIISIFPARTHPLRMDEFTSRMSCERPQFRRVNRCAAPRRDAGRKLTAPHRCRLPPDRHSGRCSRRQIDQPAGISPSRQRKLPRRQDRQRQELSPLAPLPNPGQSEPKPDHSQGKEGRLREYSQYDRVHLDTSNQRSTGQPTIRLGESPVAGKGKLNPNADQTNSSYFMQIRWPIQGSAQTGRRAQG